MSGPTSKYRYSHWSWQNAPVLAAQAFIVALLCCLFSHKLAWFIRDASLPILIGGLLICWSFALTQWLKKDRAWVVSLFASVCFVMPLVFWHARLLLSFLP